MPQDENDNEPTDELMRAALGEPAPTVEPSPAADSNAALDLEAEIADALAGVNLDELIDEGSGSRGGATTTTSTDPQPGERINLSGGRRTRRGMVMDVRGDDVMVEFGPKSTGFCPLRQFDEPPETGSHHEFLVARLDSEGLLVLSLPGAVQKADWGTLAVGQTVEGRCIGVNKGGLEVEVAHHKGFMPAGQIDVRHVPDISIFLNEKMTCRVTQLDRKRGRLLLSRRVVLDEERSANREKLLENLAPGQTVTVVITSVQEYGAFADLGGIDGLIHVTELSHERIKDPSDVLKVGDEVRVKILKIDTSGDQPKIGLSRKAVLSDPRADAMNELVEGATVSGTVKRILDFGAFVEIAPGFEGLVHISEVSHERIHSVDKVLRQGEVVQAKILSIDEGRGRVALSIKALQDRPAVAHKRGDRFSQGDVARAEDPAMRKLKARFGGDLKGGLG
jgi:small subunit ribosomal protein S1